MGDEPEALVMYFGSSLVSIGKWREGELLPTGTIYVAEPTCIPSLLMIQRLA